MNIPATEKQNNRILQIVNIYRLALSLILLLTFFISPVATQLGSQAPQLFLVVTGTYCLFSLIVALVMAYDFHPIRKPSVLCSILTAEILVISLIVYSSGGMVSGLGILMLVSVAAGTLMIRGRLAMLLPAVGSIALIYGEVYLALTLDDAPMQFMQTGMLGALLFVTAGYLQYLGERMQRSSELAAERATDIEDLAQLNHLIIQRLQTGIVLLDSNNRIINSNNSARQLLEMENPDGHPLPEPMVTLLDRWALMQTQPVGPTKVTPTGHNLQVNFARLNPSSPNRTLVFLDDHARIMQRARQLNLASLGRLTASIAHEIRNPLGAISHAGQLLDESDNLTSDERRLVEIVLNHCQRINGIIQDVLDLSRQDKKQANQFQLQQWLEAYVARYCEDVEPTPRIQIEISPPDTRIRFVPEQLTRVMNNLVENGLRYSLRATGTPTLLLRGGIPPQSLQGTPCLKVIDDGPGVASGTEENLFEPFNTTETTGTGLGLYISRQLCEANQARLEYGRSDDGRPCFTIYFSHPERSLR